MEPTSEPIHYRLVRRCCYLGMFVQAMVINLTPLFFIPLRAEFGLTFEQLGRLVLINFAMQMIVDLVCTAVVDRFGMIKFLTVIAQVFAAVGLWIFAGARFLFPEDPYTGLVLGTMVFSLGCGLLEVLISPIINAIPSNRKASAMALLHAFYPIGKVVVIALTGLVLWIFGYRAWVWIAVGWSVVPLINTIGFLRCRLPEFVHADHRTKTRVMARKPIFWLGMLAILLAGATEVTLAQWTSAFAQASLGMSQMIADWVGFGLFGVMMIFGRIWFGMFGDRVPLRPLLVGGAALSAACYFVVGLSSWPALSIAACIAAGLFVSMLWPGIVSLSAAVFPRAGISLFALLAAFGDAGAGMVPWLVGLIADSVELAALNGSGALGIFTPDQFDPAATGLRTGIFIAGIAPALLVVVLVMMRPGCPARAADHSENA